MTANKSIRAISARRDAIVEFLRIPKTRMSPGLYCYVFLALKRPRLFDRSGQQFFKWREFRGTAITAKEFRKVEAHLGPFEVDGDCPDITTVRANLKRPEYMKRAAPRIEWEMIEQELRGDPVRRAIVAEMRRGLDLNDRFRRLLKREPILRRRDVQRRLHVGAETARRLISNEERVGRIQVRRYPSAPDLIVRSEPPIYCQGVRLKP